MPAFYSHRTNIRREGNGNEHCGREDSKSERREKEIVDPAFGKNVCAMYTTYMGDTTKRTYAREQFHGNVCHINRDERERRGREMRKSTRTRKKKREKNGERYVCVEFEGGKFYGV